MLLLLLCLLPAVLSYHCGHDEEVDDERKVVMDIHPPIDLDGVNHWVSNMQFFLFGEFGDSPESATISAGFYRTNGDLVYKLVINCQALAWKTVYKPKGKKGRMWKSGSLPEPCEKGRFDIVYELQNAIRGKFIFNAIPMEGALLKQYKMAGRPRKPTWTGNYRIEKLPVDLKYGVVFKASTNAGNNFKRIAYGKCFAFPASLHNCAEARLWVLQRSKIRGSVEMYDASKNETTTFEGLGEYGAWSFANGPSCNKNNTNEFDRIQDAIMPDQNSTMYKYGLRFSYCCCASADGVLGEKCEKYGLDKKDTICTTDNLCPDVEDSPVDIRELGFS